MSHLPLSPSSSSVSSPASPAAPDADSTGEIVASAPGKVILHGEHSVVYGKMALAVAIDLRTRVRLRLVAPGKLQRQLVVSLPDLRKRYSFKLSDLSNLRKKSDLLSPSINNNSDLNHNLVNVIKSFVSDSHPGSHDDLGIVAFLYLFLGAVGAAVGDTEAVVTSEIPIGAGLGSSAAYSVAVAAALLKLRARMVKKNNNNEEEEVAMKKQKMEEINEEELEQKEVCQWAFLAEKILHGNPSGIDNTVCTFGGLLSYSHPRGMQPLEAPRNLRILLINTRVSRNTKRLVERVKNRAVALPKVTARILEAMDQVSHMGLETLSTLRRLNRTTSTAAPAAPSHRRQSGSETAPFLSEMATSSSEEEESGASSEEEPLMGGARIVKEEEEALFKTLEELIDTNQGLLSSLGVSHPSLDRVAGIAHAHGLHAKLTGAGGGGFAFALVTPAHAEAQVERVRADCARAGFDCWETRIGGKGVVYGKP